ncbi:hypothetical protein TNCV_3096481 [Trichonephila clavipes]|nr:hypothetical protein TNCV_3096481 [Trichonephila clavipes]
MLPVLGKKAVLEWCMKGLIGSSYACPKCGKSMELRERTVKPLKSLVLRCGCRRFGNPTFVYGLRNATMHSQSVVSPVMILSILLWLRTWMLKLSYVSDIVLSPPNSDKYHTLSQRLITQFSDSETQKIKKLLTDLQLGDEKPSHLLRKMKAV